MEEDVTTLKMLESYVKYQQVILHTLNEVIAGRTFSTYTYCIAIAQEFEASYQNVTDWILIVRCGIY